jgi:hypothetical protein
MASGLFATILEILADFLPDFWPLKDDRDDDGRPTIWAPILTALLAAFAGEQAYSYYHTMSDWAVWVLALAAALLAGVAYLLFWRWLQWPQ